MAFLEVMGRHVLKRRDHPHVFTEDFLGNLPGATLLGELYAGYFWWHQWYSDIDQDFTFKRRFHLLQGAGLVSEGHSKGDDVRRLSRTHIVRCLHRADIDAPLGHYLLEVGNCRLGFFLLARAYHHMVAGFRPATGQSGTEISGPTQYRQAGFIFS